MSISPKSTTGEGDITADQEYLGPTFSNLEPSEELRRLRARIAELERQKGQTNTDHSVEELRQMKEELKNTKELVGKTLEQMEALQTKMEEYQNKQQQTIDDLTKKLKANFIRGMEQKQKEEFQRKMNESLRNEQQLNIVHLQKTVATMKEIGLIPQQNR